MNKKRPWTDLGPYPGRGIIPRDVNPYKGNKFKKSISPKDWKLLEMKKTVRNIIRQEIKALKDKNPKAWKLLHETVTRDETVGVDVAGHQAPEKESYGVNELKELYSNLKSQKSEGISSACGFAKNLSEQLLDENNFEMRNAHGFNTMKRNSKYLGKLSEELEKVNDSINTGRMQALAIIDEIGMIAYRYYNKK